MSNTYKVRHFKLDTSPNKNVSGCVQNYYLVDRSTSLKKKRSKHKNRDSKMK